MKLTLFLLPLAHSNPNRRSSNVGRSTDDVSNCPPEHFKIGSMKECHPYLTCSDLDNIRLKKKINAGMAKEIHLAKWNGNTLVYSIPNKNNPERLADFQHNMAMMKSLQSPHVVQLVGICGDSIMTEYHPNGTLGDLIESDRYETDFTLLDRIKLAIRYVEILSYLHNSPGDTSNVRFESSQRNCQTVFGYRRQ
jgi:glycoprotein-mannosyl O6-kinase